MLSLFNPFAIKRIWSSYDRELCNYMLQHKNECGNYSYNYLDVVYLFSRPYYNDASKKLLKTLISGGVNIWKSTGTSHGLFMIKMENEVFTSKGCFHLGGIEDIFADQELIKRLNVLKKDVLSVLISKGLTSGLCNLKRRYISYFPLPFRSTNPNSFELDYLFSTQEQITKLNKVDSALLEWLIDKEITTHNNLAEALDSILKEIELMRNFNIGSVQNQNVSLYDFFTADETQLRLCMEQQDILNMLNSDQLRNSFPIFAEMLHDSIKKGKEILMLYGKMMYDTIRDQVNFYPEGATSVEQKIIPQEVMGIINERLDYDSRKNLLKAAITTEQEPSGHSSPSSHVKQLEVERASSKERELIP
ncbi:hypothetical protein [Wolbachia endosymbiont of Folsomia candida]|uniref:hypothetical protein n=1 Tax=Wolbachia endosymbiont of Folsomia candida TaxID=169402 RepID=UPI000A72BFAE|nr:hypothetical protein [Wolbachia endosymbiont of Folsomia candida]APR97801.1 hypothetical protein ASM33_00380 [Wolbachia endosymbiont of Folsomia candida]